MSPPGRTVHGMKKEWLSRKDLAEWLNVSMSTIVRITTSPDFPTPIRVSGSLRYNTREVERWIKTQREPQSDTSYRQRRPVSRSTQGDRDIFSKYKFTK